MDEVQNLLKEQVSTHPVVLYMKGTPTFPQCGFSAKAAQILKLCGVKHYHSVNVLEHPGIRAGIKDFSHWPTIPQAGELQKKLEGIATAA